jgi:hypothetical protein
MLSKLPVYYVAYKKYYQANQEHEDGDTVNAVHSPQGKVGLWLAWFWLGKQGTQIKIIKKFFPHNW